MSISTMLRATETADFVRAAFNEAGAVLVTAAGSHNVSADLMEMHFGDFEGLSADGNPFRDEYAKVTGAWSRGETSLRWPGEGGESPDDVAERGMAGLLSPAVLGTTESDTIVCVCHGRFNKIVLTKMLFDDVSKSTSSFRQNNTCMNVIDFDPVRHTFEAVAINSIEHLPLDVQVAELTKRLSQTPSWLSAHPEQLAKQQVAKQKRWRREKKEQRERSS